MAGALLMAASGGAHLALVASGVYQDFDTSPGAAQTDFLLTTAGAERIERTNDGNISLGDWVNPPVLAPGDYEVRCTATGDALRSGSSATGTWLALTTNRWWGIRRTAFGTSSAGLTIEIRKASGATLISNGPFTIRATIDI